MLHRGIRVALLGSLLSLPLGCKFQKYPEAPASPEAVEASARARSQTVEGVETLVAGAASQQTLRLWAGDVARSAHVFVPASRAESPGVLVLFHGLGDTGANFAKSLDAAALAERYKVVVVVPEGTPNSQGGQQSWNAGACCAFGDEETRDDSGLLAALIDAVAQVLPIDRARVDIAGFSNGGYFVEYNVCKNAELIRGALNVAGADPMGDAPCEPAKPVTLIRIHGEADEVVPIAGGSLNGRTVMSFDDSFVAWRTRMNCSTVPTMETLDYAACRFQQNCVNGEYISCRVPGMGHMWPSSSSLDVFARAWQVWNPEN